MAYVYATTTQTIDPTTGPQDTIFTATATTDASLSSGYYARFEWFDPSDFRFKRDDIFYPGPYVSTWDSPADATTGTYDVTVQFYDNTDTALSGETDTDSFTVTAIPIFPLGVGVLFAVAILTYSVIARRKR